MSDHALLARCYNRYLCFDSHNTEAKKVVECPLT